MPAPQRVADSVGWTDRRGHAAVRTGAVVHHVLVPHVVGHVARRVLAALHRHPLVVQANVLDAR